MLRTLIVVVALSAATAHACPPRPPLTSPGASSDLPPSPQLLVLPGAVVERLDGLPLEVRTLGFVAGYVRIEVQASSGRFRVRDSSGEVEERTISSSFRPDSWNALYIRFEYRDGSHVDEPGAFVGRAASDVRQMRAFYPDASERVFGPDGLEPVTSDAATRLVTALLLGLAALIVASCLADMLRMCRRPSAWT